MNRAQFSTTANAAIREGHIARKKLAEHHANNFLNSAGEFDPRRLHKLGNAGMRRFIKIVQDSETSLDVPLENASKQTVVSSNSPKISEQGWTAQQRTEPNWKMRAMMRGTLLGTAVFTCGITALAILPL